MLQKHKSSWQFHTYLPWDAASEIWYWFTHHNSIFYFFYFFFNCDSQPLQGMELQEKEAQKD